MTRNRSRSCTHSIWLVKGALAIGYLDQRLYFTGVRWRRCNYGRGEPASSIGPAHARMIRAHGKGYNRENIMFKKADESVGIVWTHNKPRGAGSLEILLLFGRGQCEELSHRSGDNGIDAADIPFIIPMQVLVDNDWAQVWRRTQFKITMLSRRSQRILSLIYSVVNPKLYIRTAILPYSLLIPHNLTKDIHQNQPPLLHTPVLVFEWLVDPY
jgi:hypothetical protein